MNEQDSTKIHDIVKQSVNTVEDIKKHSEKPEYTKTLSVKNGKKSTILKTDNIKWISSDGPYLFIHTPGKKYLVTDSLKNIVTALPENFKRIHRSTIVNVDLIVEIKSRLNGDYDLTLRDGNVIRLSRNYSKSLKGSLL